MPARSAMAVFATVVLTHSPVEAQAASWTLDSVPSFVIGASVTDAMDQFGRILGVALAGDGSLVVLDGNPVGLISFRRDGSPQARFSGEGDGPGELRDPRGVIVTDGGVVAVDARGRRSRFDLDGRLQEADRFATDTACEERSNARVAGPLSDGSVLVRCEERLFGRVRGEYRQEVGLVRFEEPGVRLAPIGWFPADSGRTDEGSIAIPRPYAPRTRVLHASAGERLFVASTDQHRIQLFGLDGQSIGSIPVPLEARPTTERDHGDQVEAALRVGGSANDQRVIREWAEEMPRASQTPVIRGMVAGAPDELWIQGWSNERVWIAMDVASGGALARVELPPGQEVVAASTDFLVLLSRDALGVETLVVRRLRRGG